MFKRLMSLGLLCLAFDAHATVYVTTTADESGTNPSGCSLREAVAMMNSGDGTQPFGGCVSADASKVIVLKANSIYPINSQLQLNSTVTIQSSTTGDFNVTDGTENPIIQAIGKHRIFSINPNGTANSPIPVVAITNVNLNGCGGSVVCDTNGGVIFNKGSLSLTAVRAYNGIAKLGGAIYNENTGKVVITNTELKDNTAEQGAALYSIQPAFSVSRSLIRNNKTENSSGVGFAIYTMTSDVNIGKVVASILGSTIYNNKASAINIVPGVGVGSVTIVGNLGGVTLNAPPMVVTTTPAPPSTTPPKVVTTFTSAFANSIVGDNNGADCTFVTGDKTPMEHIAYTNTCKDMSGLYGTFTDGKDLSGKTLIAGDTSVTDGSAVCSLPPAAGLLCPFHNYVGQFTGYLLPRLIPAPNASLANELIVNQGNNSTTGVGCTADQRGLSRVLCDIGAIELVIPAGNAKDNGQDIFYGQTAQIDLSPVVGDGQLIPAAYCVTLYNSSTPPQGGTWLDGCVRYIVSPTKGVASFDAAKNLLSYKPSSNFHGLDVFTYTITTSTSFFSEGESNKTIAVTTRIYQSPPTGITSKTVGAGGIGVFAVIALLGLALRRRLTGGQS
ncbi:MAG: rhombotarget A [Candidatus Saccharibacteria bacterium]|nr:rhombotarget A [Moraxellaceae bacterium]